MGLYHTFLITVIRARSDKKGAQTDAKNVNLFFGFLLVESIKTKNEIVFQKNAVCCCVV